MSTEPQLDPSSEGSRPAGASPAVTSGAHFPEPPSVPGFVVAGEPFTIQGTIHLDCSLCTIPRECRVVFESDVYQTDQQNVGKLSNCDRDTWRFDKVAPPSPGQTISVRLLAERNPPLESWITDEIQTFNIDVIGESEKTAREAQDIFQTWGPWVGTGAVAGAGSVGFSDDVDMTKREAAVYGAISGASGKVLFESAAPHLASGAQSFAWGAGIGAVGTLAAAVLLD